MDYAEFIRRKSQIARDEGFAPSWMSDFLFDFQKHLVEWSIRKGRAALLCDCGLGKTPMQLVWSENVIRKTNRPVLILTPLAVSAQTIRESAKFGIDAVQSRDGSIGKNITVTNYEQLHRFDRSQFGGVVCDESSILKNYSGATRNEIIAFLGPIPYRLLCTATPSPNDYTEIGNSSEALGVMRRVEMLAMFFIHDAADTGKWRVKGHGVSEFWRFMASWARAVRFPSDIGFDNGDFILPKMVMHQHIMPSKPMDGWMFAVEARTLDEQRNERRATIEDRCAQVAKLANDSGEPFVAWCSLNDESEMLAELIPDAVEVTGSQSNEEKEEKIIAFSSGKIRVLVTKPDICGFGMNWQHCNAMSFFPSHSHEQFYQAVRRCWRFGQKRAVDVHIVTTDAEARVVENMKRKERSADEMFAGIVAHMKEFYAEKPSTYKADVKMEKPSWI